MTCNIGNCNNTIECRGYCKNHYYRFNRYGDPLGKPISKRKTHCKRGHEYGESNFYKDKNGWRSCKVCFLNRMKSYYKSNPDFYLDKNNKWRDSNSEKVNLSATLRRYNLTLDEYHSLQEKYDFHCAICDESKNLRVDHDHITGKVRGLLCNSHNLALGLFQDNTEVLTSAITYLTESKL